MGERNEDISQDYKILKKVKCKGGKPAIMTIRVFGKPGDQNKQPDHVSEMDKR